VKEKDDGFVASALRYTAIATTIPAAILVGYLIGTFLDKWLGTTYLRIVFLILGVVAGFVELIRQLARDSSKK
jgi:F0F1-type ATP synthase assembly protein I